MNKKGELDYATVIILAIALLIVLFLILTKVIKNAL